MSFIEHYCLLAEEVTAVVSGEEPEAALQRLELLGLTWVCCLLDNHVG